MKSPSSPAPSGRVASLHLHPAMPGAPLKSADAIEVVAGKGIQDEPRYFGKLSRSTGQPSRRQISLIERERIGEHAVALGRPSIPPGAVRANIETLGIDLVRLINTEIQIGDAVLFLYEPRKPCEKMDAVCSGLRALMENSRQGVMAEVVRPGTIRVGDAIAVRARQMGA
jgi:MOSC domain-containing protein YiiM